MRVLCTEREGESECVDKLLIDSSPGGGGEVIRSRQVYRQQADINPVTEHTFVRYLACQHIEVRRGDSQQSAELCMCVCLSNS